MTPATRQDVIHIMQTMWERGIVELTALGVTPEDWLDSWAAKIARGDAVCFDRHAILGCDREGDAINTSFQASKSFEGPAGRAVTREMRRAIPGLMRDRGVTESRTYSLCVNPEAERWFRLLGLEEDTQYQGPRCGPFLLRRFIRRL